MKNSSGFINLYRDHIENYIELDFYEVTINMDDERYNKIYEGYYTNATHINKLTGHLILYRSMFANGVKSGLFRYYFFVPVAQGKARVYGFFYC